MAQSDVSDPLEESVGGPFPVPEPYRDLGPVPALIYVALSTAKHPIRDEEIIEAIGAEQHTVRRHIANLYADGLIEKRRDFRDARYKVYSLP